MCTVYEFWLQREYRHNKHPPISFGPDELASLRRSLGAPLLESSRVDNGGVFANLMKYAPPNKDTFYTDPPHGQKRNVDFALED